ncbi:LysR family transcriptional regulator [Gluconacetobacter sacchari]|uniref:LysR family transcriptional regulator n=2 Tax=Gluconacetobacter sacchari TaxID=92759 RepID=A0A7W4IDB2_9PROT|nr:LysR family transcriptional regulator [Gluconacetobacter sacchari]
MVANLKNISAAARKLNMTQSAVSQGIITLERTLEVSLLARTRDSVEPTAIGQNVIDLAEIAVAASAEIRTLCSGASTDDPLHLRVASVPSAIDGVMSDALRRFTKLFPNIKIMVFEGSHVEVIDWVKVGVADVGITAVFSPDLARFNLGTEELFAVLPRGHSSLRTMSVRIEEIADEVLVLVNSGCEIVYNECIRNSDILQNKILSYRSDTAIEMVRNGVGITIMPQSALTQLDMIDLRTRSFEPRAFRTLYLVHNAEYENITIDLFRNTIIQNRSVV